MHRTISPLGLLFTSVSAIMGSGWLFSSFYASEAAGPASLLSWILGGVLVCVVAFTFAEICSMIPVSGSSVRIPMFTHGKVVSLYFALIIWLSYVALMVIELLAVMQYMSYYFPSMIHQTSAGGLTLKGYCVAIGLMFVISVVNTYSVEWLIHCNTFLTFIKIIIPLGISIFIICYLFTPSDFVHPVHSTFAPYGMHGILTALSTGGIIFSFNAFKQAAELAGEAKNPNFAVPFAIVGSIVLCLILFLLLQLAFLSSLNSVNLSAGWAHLKLANINSPFASVLQQNNLKFLIPVLYFGAIISPMAAGLIYCTGGARSLFGLAANGCAPRQLRISNKRGIPYLSIWINFVIGIAVFLSFRSWDALSSLLTCLFAISYAAAPICLVALRFQTPKLHRPLRLPFGLTWSFIAFYICALLIYWTGWNVISHLIWFLLACTVVVVCFQFMIKYTGRKDILDWKSSIWMWPFFIGIIILSYLGNYGGGKKILSEPVIMISMAILCVLVVALAIKYRLHDSKTMGYINNI